MKYTILKLFLIGLVTTIGSTGIHLLTGRSLFGAALLVTSLQVIVGYVVNVYIVEKFKKDTLLAEINKLESLSTILNCAYCDHPNVKSFIPDDDANFTCAECNNQNTVVVQFSVARTTTPINSILSEPQKTHKIEL